MKLNRDNLIKWFIETYPEHVKRMCESNHNVGYLNISPWHSEGSVWTHTMMVMTWIEANKELYSENLYEALLLAGLLHDIGKPLCLEYDENKNKNSFSGHEGVSSHISIGILMEASQIFNFDLISAHKIICLHGVNVSQIDITGLKEFREADKRGAIRIETEISDYKERKFSKMHDPESNKTCTILCGLPCSGKSTWASNNITKDQFLLSRDNIITEYSKNYNEAYRYFHENEDRRKELDKKFDSLVQVSAKKSHVIVDMTMLSLKSRRLMMNRLGKRDYKCIVFFSKVSEIMERNRNRKNKFISENVIEKMMKTFVMPVKEEGFSSVKLLY